jgi:bifunctional N-acetylglucosamine-1-phosphate-uridyltransferase/glucosamine-1-phosphate-acetyltransferase GlmU-like protein
MIDILLDLYAPYVDGCVVVISPSADRLVRAHLADRAPEVQVIWQQEATGMLDAVLMPHPMLKTMQPKQVWITWCDQVAVSRRTVDELDRQAQADVDVVVPTAYSQAPYTCLLRDENNRLIDILHRREGDPIPDWGDSEMGLFSLSAHVYFDLLPEFARSTTSGAATKERNFLPFLPWVAGRVRLSMFRCLDAREALGVNTPADRARVEAILAQRDDESPANI